MIASTPGDRRAADHAAARHARRGPRLDRARAVRDRSSSGSGTCRSSPATSTSRGQRQPRPRRARSQAPRGDDRRPQRQRARRQPPGQRRPARPGEAAAERDGGGWPRYGQQVIAPLQAPQGLQGRPDRHPAVPRRAAACASRAWPRSWACGAHDPGPRRPLALPRELLAAPRPRRRRRAVRDYVEERSDQFPGVDVDRVYLRRYPQGTLARPAAGQRRARSPTSSSS